MLPQCEDVTAATDVYALGVIAYEMLTGGRPFDGANQATLITQALTTEPVTAATRRTGLPPAIDAAVMKALSKDTSARWPSVAAFADAMQAAAGQLPSAGSAGESGLLSRYELGPMIGRGRLGSLVYQGTHRALVRLSRVNAGSTGSPVRASRNATRSEASPSVRSSGTIRGSRVPTPPGSPPRR